MLRKHEIESYIINHLWFGRKNQTDQLYIHNAKTSEEFEDKFLSPITKCALANSNANIYIWYNSLNNSISAINNTNKALHEYRIRNGADNITLIDVLEIPFIKENKYLLNGPPYFCVDSLKMMLPLYCFTAKNVYASIFNDFSVGALNPDKMSKGDYFDQKSMQQTVNNGIILNRNISVDSKYIFPPEYVIENQHIMMINNEDVIKILELLVNINAIRAKNIFNMSENMQKALTPIMYCMPYHAITHEFPTLFKGLREKTIKVRADCIGVGTSKEWIDYDLIKHGIELFGTHLKLGSTKYNVKYEVKIGDKVFDRDEVIEGMQNTLSIEDLTKEIKGTRSGNPHLEEPVYFNNQNFKFSSWFESNNKHKISPQETAIDSEIQLQNPSNSLNTYWQNHVLNTHTETAHEI